MGREESFQNGIASSEADDAAAAAAAAAADETEQPAQEMKRKSGKVRGTTGDLAKFLRTEQQLEHAKGHGLSSPHGAYLHSEHPLLSNAASMYSLATDLTGTMGMKHIAEGPFCSRT